MENDFDIRNGMLYKYTGTCENAELHRMEELQNARQEMNRTKDEAV